MRLRSIALAAAAAAALAIPAAGPAPRVERPPVRAARPPGHLPAFASEQELADYLRRLGEEVRRQRRRQGHENLATDEMALSVAEPEAQAAPPAAPDESITNVQEAGVDEGSIVKVHGDYLVVLRRGRLFTVSIAGGGMRPVSMVDAFAPGTDPSQTWYDEMLVSGDRVVVIGYSYQRGGTEVGLFRIDPAGRLAYESTYHLRAEDYYSARNYASRLIGHRLVFYSARHLAMDPVHPLGDFPALRRWHTGARDDEFRGYVAPTRVYKAGGPLEGRHEVALHTVTTCDLSAPEMACEATAVLGPAARVFYVSPHATYVWASSFALDSARASRGIVYRIPLDGGPPSALAVSGAPMDPFALSEQPDGTLNALLRDLDGGDAMWSAVVPDSGHLALFRAPISSFGDGSATAPASSYRPLPEPGYGEMQNRFVGDRLLYGTGSGWWGMEGTPRDSLSLFVVPLAGGAVAKLAMPHRVDRIEVMGTRAVVVGGSAAGLGFTAVRLDGAPRLAQRYLRPDAAQGELRSHGFFYRPQPDGTGVLGLPIGEPARPGYAHLFTESASVLFVRNDGERFTELGTLGAHPGREVDDGCRASCVDWYGNSRPIFLRGRTFALLGYELVEGSLQDGRMRELRRVSFAPRAMLANR